MTEFENIDHVVEERAIKGEDPYRLKDYQSDVIPPDGGHAPLPKTAEPEAYHDNRIYVSNIPFTFKDEDLVNLFRRFGEVASAMIVCNERGSKGFGFVTMDSIDSCERARKALHGTRILGRIIEVRKATPLARPANRRGPGSVSSSCTSSPRRVLPKGPMRKKTNSHNNPHVVPAANMGILQSDLTTGQSTVPSTPVMPVAQLLNQQTNALNMLLSENPMLLQNLLAPYPMQQIRQQLPVTMPHNYYAAAQMFPSPLHTSFLPCTIPPLQQTQPGFPYRIASSNMELLSQPYMPQSSYVVGPRGACLINNENATGTGGSLNNTLMNATLLSTSINAHMQGMQDHLVNLLNLDGTLNHSKLMELRANGSRNSSLLNGSSSSSELNDSGRKRRAAMQPNEQDSDSPKKIGRF